MCARTGGNGELCAARRPPSSSILSPWKSSSCQKAIARFLALSSLLGGRPSTSRAEVRPLSEQPKPSTPYRQGDLPGEYRLTSSRAQGSCRATGIVPLIQESARSRVERSLLGAPLQTLAHAVLGQVVPVVPRTNKSPSLSGPLRNRRRRRRRVIHSHEFGRVQSPSTGHAGVLQRQECPAHG